MRFVVRRWRRGWETAFGKLLCIVRWDRVDSAILAMSSRVVHVVSVAGLALVARQKHLKSLSATASGAQLRNPNHNPRRRSLRHHICRSMRENQPCDRYKVAAVLLLPPLACTLVTTKDRPVESARVAPPPPRPPPPPQRLGEGIS
jgi:hypothetical protein